MGTPFLRERIDWDGGIWGATVRFVPKQANKLLRIPLSSPIDLTAQSPHLVYTRLQE